MRILKIKLDYSWKEALLSISIGLITLGVFSFLSSANQIQMITKLFFFLFFIPFLYIKLVLKKSFFQFGFNLNNKKTGFIWGIFTLAASCGIFYLLINFTSFPKFYTLPTKISNNFWIFIFYELILINISLFFQEYFFKGFLISILREKLLYFSIAFQAIIYLIPLLIIATSTWSLLPLITISILGGIVAYKTKTFFYSYLYALLFFIFLDAYLIYFQRNFL